MPLSIHDKALQQQKDLMEQVFAGDSNAAGEADEDRRRRARGQQKAASVVQKPTPAIFSGPQALTTPPTPPPPQTIIDRLHKYAGSGYGGFVFVGRDHDVSEVDQMPPINPGYKTETAVASSLNDAYAKARDMASRLKAQARIAILVLGGIWDEDLTLDTNRIDIHGMGRPLVHGHFTIPSTNIDCVVGRIEVQSGDNTAAILVSPGTYGPIDPTARWNRQAPIRLYDAWAHGPLAGLEFYKRIHVEGSWLWQDSNWTDGLERAAVIAHAAIDDQDWTIFERCIIESYIKRSAFVGIPLGVPEPAGFAIKATAKLPSGDYIYSNSGLTGQTAAYYSLENSGLRLINCTVEGSLLNEGWTVDHIGGTQKGGIPYPTARGGIYARQRGFALYNSLGDFFGHVPARTFFDHATTNAALIAQFVADPAQASQPDRWGGKVNFVNSKHATMYGAVPGSPFQNAGGGGAEADIVESMTGATGWNPGVMVVNTYGSCPVGVPFAAMYDPYWL